METKKLKRFAFINTQKYKKHLETIAFAAKSNVSCLKDDNYSYKKVGYKPCDVPFKSSDWYDITRGDQGTKTVALYIEGGPYLTNISKKNLWISSMLEQHELLFMKNIFHMKKPLALHYEVKRVEAEKEMNEYYDILEKIILEQQALGKKVILLGHSFGSFIVNKFLQTKGTIADLAISIGTRIAYDKKLGNQMQKLSRRLDSPFGFIKPGIKRFDWDNKPYSHISGAKLTIATLFRIRDFKFFASFLATTASFSINEWDTTILDKSKVIFISSVVDNYLGAFNQEEKDFAMKYGRHIEYSKADVEKAYKDWFYTTPFGLKAKDKTPPKHSTSKDWVLAGHYSGVTPSLNHRWSKIADEMLKKR